jgi:hypothetical protein
LLEWLSRVVGRNYVYRRCIQSYRHQFDAALVLTATRWRGVHQIQLWVRPEFYGCYEVSLFQWIFVTLQEHPRWPVQITLSRDHSAALAVVQEYGFRVQQTLLTMRRKIE